MRGRGPVLGGQVNQIDRRVLHFRVRPRISQILRQTALEFSISLSRSGMGAQVITEQERIALIGSPLHPHMRIGAALPWWLVELQFVPLGPRPSEIGWAMVAPGPLRQGVSEGGHRGYDLIIERGHRNLDIDHVFGGQPTYGGRTNMIDAQSQIAQRPAKERGNR